MVKKVSVEAGCITCGLCEFLAPDIFQVTDISRVKQDAPIANADIAIKEASERCPVQVIRYEEDSDYGNEKK